MRYLEGTPEEIAEYLRLTEGVLGSPEPDNEPHPSAVNEAGPMTWADIEAFAQDRGGSNERAQLVLPYLREVRALEGVEFDLGTSKRTRDGLNDYIMVRNAGKQLYGAVAYVKATNGGLTLRLTREDVADLHDRDHIQPRQVKSGQKYAINCPLRDQEALQLAVELTRRALTKVRS